MDGVKKINWLLNLMIAIGVATFVAAGFLIVCGEPAGPGLWLWWAIVSLFVSTIMDLRRDH